jgi:hypothetical protein
MGKFNEIMLVTGVTGSGKTHYVRKETLTKERIIIADPMDQFFGGIIFDKFNEDQIIDHLIDVSEKENFRFIFKYSNIDVAYPELFRIIAKISLDEKILQNFWFVVDEASLWGQPSKFDPSLARILKIGRNSGINQIYIAQRPFMLDVTFRSQASEFIAFRQTEKTDLQYLEKAGFKAEDLKSLPKAEEWLKTDKKESLFLTIKL